MIMRSRIDLMMHSSQGDITYLLRGIFIQCRERKKGWEFSSNEGEFPLNVESHLDAMSEEKKCGFIALTIGIFIQWRKRRKGGLSLDAKSHLPPMWEE
jgi:hypothetical protein